MIVAAHPFVTFPLSLAFLKKKFARPLKADENPAQETYAVCMCAYNEEGVIREKAENLLAMKKLIPGLDVHIYVDCASDRTAEILSEYKEHFDVVVATERHGKTYGMNLLVSRAKASIIIFTDANVMLDPTTIPALEKYFADPSVGCVCGHLIYINAEDGATAATGSLYWKIEEKIKQLESDTGSLMGADGSIFAIRRALHTPPPADIIDDMFVSFSILCDGHRIVRAADVIAYEKSVTAPKEEFKRKIRIACQAFNVHRLLWPRLKEMSSWDLYKYISHKLIRWFTILWLFLAAVFFELALFSAGWEALAVLLPVLGIGALWAGIRYNISPAPQLFDILTSFAGVGIGIVKSLSGERFQTWAPAQSIRQ
jgi:cellulose synthase/poly-beta-1,6-N-acetylglucosamine synthase-like glycosyltransferase